MNGHEVIEFYEVIFLNLNYTLNLILIKKQ